MSLESATYISQLVPSNPTGADPKSQGDDHLRLIKQTLQNTFPGASGPDPYVKRAGDTMTGNLNFSGPALRFTANFSDNVLNNRMFFQTNVPNGNTTLGILHAGGSATAAQVVVYSAVNPDDSSTGALTMIAGSDFRIQSSRSAETASFIPMTFYTGGLERMRIDHTTGAVLFKAPAAFGYELGAGGSVVQPAGSKSNPVTINKPCGTINLDNTPIPGSTTVQFQMNNTCITALTDMVHVSVNDNATMGLYEVWTEYAKSGNCQVFIRNRAATVTAAEPVVLSFSIIKSVNS